MRLLRTTCVIFLTLSSAVLVAATEDSNYDPSYNFRPYNVTMSALYNWVGSYYNGTTRVEFLPYTGLAASNSSLCPVFRNEIIIKEYPTVLGLTEPSKYNTANDPVNAMITLWPPGFNFSNVPPIGWIQDISEFKSLQWYLWSSTPLYKSTFTMSESPKLLNDFDWSLEKTQEPPFNLSGTVIDDEFIGEFPLNMTSCNRTGEVPWRLQPIAWNSPFNGVRYPYPTISLQFDHQSANISFEGYFSGERYYEQEGLRNSGDSILVGKFELTFLGAIDSYHSDVLENDTATPIWLRTVGFQNNSLNVGYALVSTGSQLIGSLSLATLTFIVLEVALFLS
ncbi:hypothetical protein N7466_002991 [Penicillium verhagenii]|uniref:uncharacterized protein n=1 Tax=Penicillium verhagenii TaxID=1562060 RepID=UPI0025458FEB|nr:uncharacterized protein N7466_002991 [Penicillium verhagenii]KAJ5936541.1 hypothetical protein N7466_002991 [Penicillium verhagenii]